LIVKNEKSGFNRSGWASAVCGIVDVGEGDGSSVNLGDRRDEMEFRKGFLQILSFT
jgi:hypothetical protein